MKKDKKILLISHDLAIAGASMSLLAIANILKAKYKVEVWSLSNGPLKKEYDKNHIICKVIQNQDFNYLANFMHNYNLIIINTVIPNNFAQYCQENNLPHIWLIREATNIPEFYDRTQNLPGTIKSNKNIYVTSEYAKAYIDKEFKTNVGVLHNFIPDVKQKIESKVEKRENKKLQFSLIGYFTPRKGLDICIDAIEALGLEQKNKMCLNIVGNKSTGTQKYWEPLWNKTKNLPETYNWTGEIWGDDKWKLFLETDVFVIPSLDESCSRVVLEAMMLGKPVIVTENVGAKYMVNDRTGWIAKTGNVESLRDCIQHILDNPEELPKMGKETRKMYLESSTEEIYKENLIKIIENHIDKSKKGNFMQNEIRYKFMNFDMQKVFSVKNNKETCHKVVTICGLQIKLKSQKLKQEKTIKKLEERIKLQERETSNIKKRLTDVIYKSHKYCHPEMRATALKDWYFEHTGENLNLENPQTFNEKIQWMKLYDSTPLKTRLADKYLVREWVKEKIGEEYLIPNLGVWDSFDEINFDELPDQFVLKCNHGSGYNIIVKDKSKLDLKEARKKIDFWMNEDFAFKCGFEMHYTDIPRKIIAEEYIDPASSNVELQAWCFNGKVEFISYETCKDAELACRELFSLNWKRKPSMITPQHYTRFSEPPKKPDYLEELIKISTIMAQGFKHARIDFVPIDNKLKFREITFTSGSGLSKFEPDSTKYELGNLIKL